MRKIKKIGIAGGGKMGTDIFNFLSQYPYEIVFYNRSSAEKIERKYKRRLERALKNKIVSEEIYTFKKKHHILSSSVYSLKDVDVIIESVSEDLKIKQELINKLFSFISPKTIIASNSSSFLPSQLSSEKKFKDRILGLHFFFPLKLKPISELIISNQISEETVRIFKDFLQNININYLFQNEENAFLLNRTVLKWQAKTYNYVKENGISFSETDTIVKKYLCSAGIFETIDYVGFEIIYNSAMNYLRKEKNNLLYFPLLNFMKEGINGNKTGIKSQQGFFDYSSGKELFNANSNNEKKILKFLIKSFYDSYNQALKEINNKNINLEFFFNEYLDAETGKWKKYLKDE